MDQYDIMMMWLLKNGAEQDIADELPTLQHVTCTVHALNNPDYYFDGILVEATIKLGEDFLHYSNKQPGSNGISGKVHWPILSAERNGKALTLLTDRFSVRFEV